MLRPTRKEGETMSIVDVGNEGYLLDQIDTLEAEAERLTARVAELEVDPRMALTYDDLAYCAAATRHDSHSILTPAAQRWVRLVAARDAVLAAEGNP